MPIDDGQDLNDLVLALERTVQFRVSGTAMASTNQSSSASSSAVSGSVNTQDNPL